MIDLTPEQLQNIVSELGCCLRAWHELPSEQMSDTLMSHLYDKYSKMFGIDVLEGVDENRATGNG